jgi:hypothetical protein
MKKILFLIVIIVSVIACKKTEKEPLGPTDVRIRNITTLTMTDLTVNTGGGEYNYGILNSDSVTDYHRFDKAYQKANISAYINGFKYKTDTAVYTYMVYLGQVKATCEIWIENDAQRKLEMQWIYESELK